MLEDKINCEGVQRVIAGDFARDFTLAEAEHLAGCDACADLLLTRMLNQKPEIAVPAEFVARVRSRLPNAPDTAKIVRTIPAYGFTTAIAVLMVLALAWGALNSIDPRWWTLNGTLSLVLESVVTLEIGGIALWLGIRPSTE